MNPRERARRLERVLAVRRIEERIARGDFASAQDRVAQSEAAALEGTAQVQEALAQLGIAQGPGTVTPGAVLAFTSTLPGLERHRRRLSADLRVQRSKAEEARRVWSAAEQRRRSVERLGERMRTAVRKDEEQRAQAALDEAASVRDRGMRSGADSGGLHRSADGRD